MAGGGVGGDRDPFDGLRLDEDFVRAARTHELSAAERAERARDAAAELRRQRRAQAAGRRQRRVARTVRTTSGWLRSVLVVAVLVGVWHWTNGGSDGPQPLWESGTDVFGVVGPADRPTLARSESSRPLGAPPPPPAAGGPHRFSAMQPGSVEQPVAYDPCRSIPVVINDRTAPPGGDAIVAESLDEVSALTGLRFVVEGATDELPTADRPAFQPDRYGDRWAPVLLAWSDEAEVPELAGDIAGIGGSVHLSGVRGDPDVYVSGIVFLDGPELADLLGYPEGRDYVRAVVLHELGHLVGLDHVDADDQLMYPYGTRGVVTFAAGDRAGLARLGAGACVDRL